MTKIYFPSEGAQSWQGASPERHWRTGYSAKALAHCWHAADGLPQEIAALFRGCPDFAGREPELLLALPEWKVPLPGGRRDSQNDVFALVRCGEKTIAMMIEGKVAETFGPTMSEWLAEASDGKQVRLAHIRELLGLTDEPRLDIRYQLLHRTASAAIEAERFGTDAAVMVVQSFSPERLWFDDFAAFCRLLGVEAASDRLVRAGTATRCPLYLGWATGEERFLRI